MLNGDEDGPAGQEEYEPLPRANFERQAESEAATEHAAALLAEAQAAAAAEAARERRAAEAAAVKADRAVKPAAHDAEQRAKTWASAASAVMAFLSATVK